MLDKLRPLHNSDSLEKTGQLDEISHLSEPTYAGRLIGGERNSKDRQMDVFNKENQLCNGLKLGKIICLLAFSFLLFGKAFAFDPSGKIYQTRIKEQHTGAFLSCSLIQFHSDGTVIISDSDQQGDSTFQPFGIQHGYWKQKGNNIILKTINFRYPKYFTTDHPNGSPESSQGIVVGDYKLKVDPKKPNHLIGKVFLTFFGLKDNVNKSNKGVGPFFSGDIKLIRFKNKSFK